MNTKPHTNKHQQGLLDFGAGVLLIIGTIAVATLLGTATWLHDNGLPPAYAPDGWYMQSN